MAVIRMEEREAERPHKEYNRAAWRDANEDTETSLSEVLAQAYGEITSTFEGKTLDREAFMTRVVQHVVSTYKFDAAKVDTELWRDKLHIIMFAGATGRGVPSGLIPRIAYANQLKPEEKLELLEKARNALEDKESKIFKAYHKKALEESKKPEVSLTGTQCFNAIVTSLDKTIEGRTRALNAHKRLCSLSRITGTSIENPESKKDTKRTIQKQYSELLGGPGFDMSSLNDLLEE